MPNKCDIPNKIPRSRTVSIVAAEEFANKKGILYYGEWSAFQNINIRTTIKKLLQEIYQTQCELIKKGIIRPEGLRITVEQKEYQQRERWWSK